MFAMLLKIISRPVCLAAAALFVLPHAARIEGNAVLKTKRIQELKGHTILRVVGICKLTINLWLQKKLFTTHTKTYFAWLWRFQLKI
jgi:hypothetical protein